MGGNIFSNLKLPEYPDFTGDRARYEALKHAELQRKLQTQQALMQQAEFGHKQKEWQRQEDWQAALGSNPLVDPETGQIHPTTLKTLVGIDAPKALALSQSIDTSREARLKSEAAAQARLEHQQQLALHDIDAGMQIADPQERLTYVMQNWERYKKLKVLTDDEHEELARTGLTVPLHDRMATRLLGADKFNEYQTKALTLAEAQKKAASEAITRPAEEQKKLLEADLATRKKAAVQMFGATSQEEWDKARNTLPEDVRPLVPAEFNQKNRYKALTLGQTPTEILAQEQRTVPDTLDKLNWWLAQPNRTEEEKRVGLAAKQGMIASKVATQQDRLLNPAEFAQALELATAKSKALQEGKPPTQGEELLAGYAARVKQANQGFETLTMGGKEMVWNKLTPNFLNTEAGQVFAQNERNFINSVLRRESGAAISPPEFTSARAQYIPQPGDSPAVLEKKRRNRLIVQQSLIRGSGRAYVDPDELLRQAGVDPATLTPGEPAPAAAPGTIPSPLLSGGKPSPLTPQGSRSGKAPVRWGKDANGNPVRLN